MKLKLFLFPFNRSLCSRTYFFADQEISHDKQTSVFHNCSVLFPCILLQIRYCISSRSGRHVSIFDDEEEEMIPSVEFIYIFS